MKDHNIFGFIFKEFRRNFAHYFDLNKLFNIRHTLCALYYYELCNVQYNICAVIQTKTGEITQEQMPNNRKFIGNCNFYC